MSSLNEKYIGDSLLRSKPKKKLLFVIPDGSIDGVKIAPGAIDEHHISSALLSYLEGSVLSSLGLSHEDDLWELIKEDVFSVSSCSVWDCTFDFTFRCSCPCNDIMTKCNKCNEYEESHQQD